MHTLTHKEIHAHTQTQMHTPYIYNYTYHTHIYIYIYIHIIYIQHKNTYITYICIQSICTSTHIYIETHTHSQSGVHWPWNRKLSCEAITKYISNTSTSVVELANRVVVIAWPHTCPCKLIFKTMLTSVDFLYSKSFSTMTQKQVFFFFLSSTDQNSYLENTLLSPPTV